jgi:hypothetical protein
MSDMKRRVNGILEYITRKQVELVSDPLLDSTSRPSQASTEDGSISTTEVHGDSSNKKHSGEAPDTNGATHHRTANATALAGEFKEMSCIEMMDALTRDLFKWQQEFIQ